MESYIKKQVEAEAVKFKDQTEKELTEIFGVSCTVSGNAWEDKMFITGGELKNQPITKGDYIVKEEGKVRIVPADVFEDSYVLAERTSPPKEPSYEEILAGIEKGLKEETLKLEDLSEYDLKLYAKAKEIKNAHSMKPETIISKLQEENK